MFDIRQCPYVASFGMQDYLDVTVSSLADCFAGVESSISGTQAKLS